MKKTKKTKRKKKVKENNPKVTVREELRKITNIKSVEQLKKPKKIAFMVCFYVFLFIALIAFLLIKFSRIKKVEIVFERETENRVIETIGETYYRDDLFAINQSDAANLDDITEEAGEEVTEEATEKATEVVEETSKVETTKAETTKKETTKAETTKVEDSEINETVKPRQSTPRINLTSILPRYNTALYSYSTFYQMPLEEIGVVYNALEADYKQIENKVFGEAVTFTEKGKNGITYLNYTNLKDFITGFSDETRNLYDSLERAPYYSYIMNKTFEYSHSTYTTNLRVWFDFRKAVDKGLYYEVPAIAFEPNNSKVSKGREKILNLRVLKKSNFGYSQSFELASLLEILDIECNTKHNPYFDIKEIVGVNPSAVAKMFESEFNIPALISDSIFNYVLFDKKGYVTGAFMFQS